MFLDHICRLHYQINIFMSAAGMCVYACMQPLNISPFFTAWRQVKKFRAHYRFMRVYYYNQIYTLFSIQAHQGHALELILMRYVIRDWSEK